MSLKLPLKLAYFFSFHLQKRGRLLKVISRKALRPQTSAILVLTTRYYRPVVFNPIQPTKQNKMQVLQDRSLQPKVSFSEPSVKKHCARYSFYFDYKKMCNQKFEM